MARIRIVRPDFDVVAPKVLDDCQGCDALARWVKRTGVEWRCWDCGAVLEPPADSGQAGGRPDPWTDLELVAEFGPYVEGSAVPLNAPLHFDSKFASSTTGRARLLANDGAGACVGAEDQARRLDAQTMHVAGTHVVAQSGRPDHIDERSPDFHAATVARRRLDLLAATPDGARHALVLLFAGYWMGPAARDRWWHATEDDAALGFGAWDDLAGRMREAFGDVADTVDRPAPLGFDWYLGVVFADPVLRATWLGQGLLGRAVARLAGQRMLEAAVDAYRSLPADPPLGAVPRLALDRARDALGAATQTANADIREMWRGRVSARRTATAKRVATRAAERAA